MKNLSTGSRLQGILLPVVGLVICAAVPLTNSNAIAKTKKSSLTNCKTQTGKASYYCQRFHGGENGLRKNL